MTLAPTETPLADPQALARLHRWGGAKLIQEMAALFRSEAPTRLLIARQATCRGDVDAVERAAHSLKSTCAQLGATRMHALAHQAEMLSAQGRLDDIGALLDHLERELVAFQEWLDVHASQDHQT